ncbi:MAG: class I SAM-dependent methyltransferase [bacterium]|nr:class I SAM-dependent methyltransferase [bacterium]
MKAFVKRLLNEFKTPEKYRAEEAFWIKEISRLVLWYHGQIKELYHTPSPTDEQKFRCHTIEHSAILTWFELHQKPKYAFDLQLPVDVFRGMRVLDIGAGPMPSAEVFEDCELYCLDPLIPNYVKAGYPLHCYRANTRFVYGYVEQTPFQDDYFDAVIAMNAIDHIDDIYLAAQEIRRILKPNGIMRMHVHYHKKTKEEPLELHDEIIKKAFVDCHGFKKITEMDKKMSASALPSESYALWSNFKNE